MHSPAPQQESEQTKLSKPNILFLCTGNSCRSQMAEGFAKRFLGDKINAYSAGINPGTVNPLAMLVMAEVQTPIEDHTSKHINDLATVDFAAVITVCGHADEACPVMPGQAVRIHHGFDDPPRLAQDTRSTQEALVHYRRVRDEIGLYVKTQLMNDLAGALK